MKKYLPYILIIIVSAGLAFLVYKKPATAPPIEAGFYKNDIYGFSILLADYMKVGNFEEGEGAALLVQNERYQMQIYITPFDEDIALTLARVKQDLPDLKMEEGIEIETDGVATVAFFSNDKGERYREIWFVHNFQLYQILARAEHDQITSDVMNTWKWD